MGPSYFLAKVAEVLSQSRAGYSKFSIHCLLARTSRGDIFRFLTARKVRSHVRTNLALKKASYRPLQTQDRQPFAFLLDSKPHWFAARSSIPPNPLSPGKD